ncbi:MAG: hypothetical protein WD024_03390 [Bacillota bacterium]
MARRPKVDQRFVVERRAPAYLSLSEGELEQKVRKARKLASPCVLCGRRCSVMRFAGEDVDTPASEDAASPADSRSRAVGVCKTADKAVVSDYGPHYGEEPPLCSIDRDRLRDVLFVREYLEGASALLATKHAYDVGVDAPAKLAVRLSSPHTIDSGECMETNLAFHRLRPNRPGTGSWTPRCLRS